jgi:AcrR family transcriptional regulator
VAGGIGLRERKKQQTRQLLWETARHLFIERGFENVTVAEIARAADVSEPTVFNYFPRKEDLVFSGMEIFEDALLDAIRSRPPGDTILAAFARFIVEPRGLLVAGNKRASDELLKVSRMITSSSSLLARERQILAHYTDSLAKLISDETNAAPDDPRPYVVATALVGLHGALIAFVRGQILSGQRDLVRLARDMRAYAQRALALLEEGFGRYGPAQINDPPPAGTAPPGNRVAQGARR